MQRSGVLQHGVKLMRLRRADKPNAHDRRRASVRAGPGVAGRWGAYHVACLVDRRGNLPKPLLDLHFYGHSPFFDRWVERGLDGRRPVAQRLRQTRRWQRAGHWTEEAAVSPTRTNPSWTASAASPYAERGAKTIGFGGGLASRRSSGLGGAFGALGLLALLCKLRLLLTASSTL